MDIDDVAYHKKNAIKVFFALNALNSPHTSAVTVEVLGHHLHFSQDPNSKHLGTTVWDASMVFVKFLEKNRRKGRFSPSKLKGKRAVELGAGCGLAGFGMALLGCDVVATDQVEVLPLLMRNVERNISRVMQANTDSASIGSIQVAELDWGNEEHVKAIDPPVDFIIGTDIVYSESLLDPLLRTIFALSGGRTTILMCSEIRSTSVHEQMLRMWNSNFEVTTVPRSKMDSKYQHPSIQLHVMSMKSRSRFEENLGGSCGTLVNPENHGDCGPGAWKEGSEVEGSADAGLELGLQLEDEDDDGDDDDNGERKLDDWESRRCGSAAARLLRDVKAS
ncbi:unnamed protein product [Spirodela intermedia]|uniref:Uncharacterized protein n=1 Tax=Spirodela intermedia TaxID=51605 RepID=A0A7I8KMH1_SPIIN|nr:unnamed protein product [Spirodela intermedia]